MMVIRHINRTNHRREGGCPLCKPEGNLRHEMTTEEEVRLEIEGCVTHEHNKKKNTRRWCKGKKGREHKIIHIDDHPKYGYIDAVDMCENCGKVMHFHFHDWGWSTREDKCLAEKVA